MTWRSAADHIDAVMEARERAADRAQKRRNADLFAEAEKARKKREKERAEREARLAEIMRRTHCDECLDEKKTIANMGCLCSCHVGKLHVVKDIDEDGDAAS